MVFIGLIPAHAGKTSFDGYECGLRGAHPRSRGENWLLVALRVGVEGSSPLTRGKRGEGEQGGPLAGLIPAHAGKTARLPHLARARRAHPRSRGENFTFGLSNRVVTGSSPLTRGKRGRASARSSLRGLIPAHAGKTRALTQVSEHERAHPRSRGENYGTSGVPFCAMGSSPLTRGKRAWALAGVPLPRLIPAHAGKTRRPRPRRRP